MMLLICGILKKGTNELIYKTEIETQMSRTYIYTPRRVYKNIVYSAGNST